MTPQPMSDAEIQRVLSRIVRLEVERAIAARDAQWREMLGEPVAWGHTAHVDGAWVLQWPIRPSESGVREDLAMYSKSTALRVSPLYAIKETP